MHLIAYNIIKINFIKKFSGASERKSAEINIHTKNGKKRRKKIIL